MSFEKKEIFTKLCKVGFCFVTSICLVLVLSACSDDEDEVNSDDEVSSEEDTSSSEFNEEYLLGTWYCVYQEWYEDGETEYSEYEIPSDYYMVFNDDNSGYLVFANEDELFEIGTSKTKEPFTWLFISPKLKLWLTDRNHSEWYTILSLTKSELSMRWSDDGYVITCTFERDE